MRYGSLFSGIEAAAVAWRPLGWTCAWVAETDPFACAVLKHRYPQVPNLGDVNAIDAAAVEPVDLIVFGSPCQSFSVAGKRLGLDDPRGNMALVGLRVVGQLRPKWVVWENVPGVLSSDGGRDFGAFLGLLGELGYGFAYRVLDAQHFGVPQRRRRVFVVGYLGDWRGAAAVLFEPESLRGDPAPRRAAGERVARPVASCAPGGSGYRNDSDTADNLIAIDGQNAASIGDICGTLQGEGMRRQNRGFAVAHTLRADGFDASSEDGTGRGTPLIPVSVPPCAACNGTGYVLLRSYPGNELLPYPCEACGGTGRGTPLITAFQANAGVMPAVMTLAIRGLGNSHDLEWRDDGIANAVLTPNGGRAGIGVGAVAFHENQRAETTLSDTVYALKVGGGKPGQGYPAVMALKKPHGSSGNGAARNSIAAEDGEPMFTLDRDSQHGIAIAMSVRRLTPLECERLQGLPDDYTLVPYRGKPAADGPRYRAIGNSFAVPVVRWIGERIQQFEDTMTADAGEDAA